MPGMPKRNWGRIVFIFSESALNIPTEMIRYGVTEIARLGVSRGLAELTRGTSVTVNAVLPGPTTSEGVETFVKDLAKQNMVVYVSSKEASATNGAAPRVEGGIVRTIA